MNVTVVGKCKIKERQQTGDNNENMQSDIRKRTTEQH